MAAASPTASGRAARRLGRRGERVAVKALRRAGYRVLARNACTPHGEIDVVALEDGAIVLVEVKTTGAADGCPAESRWGRPQRSRARAAGRWMGGLRDAGSRRIRHDLVAVTFAGRRPVVTIRRAVSVRGRRAPSGDLG
jgi:putative endonuclease